MAEEYIEGILDGDKDNLHRLLHAMGQNDSGEELFREFSRELRDLRQGLDVSLTAFSNLMQKQRTQTMTWINSFGLPNIKESAPETLINPDDNKRMVIFDFDQTLAVVNVRPNDILFVTTKVFGGAVRLRAMREMLQELKKLGVVMAIISYNNEGLINQVLKKAKLRHHFRHVIGYERFSGRNCFKSTEVLGLMVKEGITKSENVLFADDYEPNCEDVQVHVPDLKIVYVEKRRGLTSRHTRELLKWASGEEIKKPAKGIDGKDEEMI